MTGTVARGGCRTSAGRVRLWGRGRAARGARARGLSEAARARPDARARKATCGRGARRSRASIRRHFDVVNQVYGREKGTACARGSRTARGEGPSARLRAETRAAAVATAARCDDWLAGRRSRRARPPRAPRAARGKGRQSALRWHPDGRISHVEARTFSVRDARVGKARALASAFPKARADASLRV